MNRYIGVALAAFAAVCGAVAKPVDLSLGNGEVLRVEGSITRINTSAGALAVRLQDAALPNVHPPGIAEPSGHGPGVGGVWQTLIDCFKIL